MNFYKDFDFQYAGKFLKAALKEDAGKGDVTSELLIPERSESTAVLLAKEKGIVAGLKIFELVFEIVDSKVKIKFLKKDGDRVKPGDKIALVKGRTRSLLLGERLSLNMLQKMSGVATMTDRMAKKLNDRNIQIIDTRKTTPNMRAFEKLAVKIGGGANHRFGLYDMILIKDNHIEANGGLEKTLERLKRTKKSGKKIEIEVRSLRQFEIVLETGRKVVDRVMLDNFKVEDVRKAVKMNNGLFEIEVSGGVNEDNISKYRNIKGIDYISSGSITHSAKSLDISLDFT